MTLKEKKIKEDILNEIDVPNVLSKVRPYAQEQSTEFGSKKIRYFSLSKILTASFAGLVGVIALIILIQNGFSKSNFLDMSEKSYEVGENSGKDFSYDNEPGLNPQAPGNETSNDDTKESQKDLYNYYSGVVGNKLSEEKINNYYFEIKQYMNEGKTKEEIIEIYEEENSEIDQESIETIYAYINDNN